MRKILTVVLDGFGYREEEYGNAIKMADTKNFDRLWETFPHTTLFASEEYVGLNEGEFGNSEIGHMTIGAGRRIMQHGPRITEFLKNINKDNLLFAEFLKDAQEKTVHIVGLYSDGKVHSNLEHFLSVYQILKENNAKKINFHLITDGRDTKINAAINFIKDLEETIKDDPITDIASICGRYYAMDRDTNYDRTKIYYDLLTKGIGIKARSEKPGLIQRCSSSLVSKIDQEEAILMGEIAIDAALKNINGVMSGIKRISSNPYKIEPILIPIEKVMMEERLFPKEYIINGNDISDEFIKWLKPLVNETKEFVDFLDKK